jgi:acyl dehydratase
MARRFETVTVGEALPSVAGVITQETINDYADMSDDYNPLHVDPAFGRATPYASTIAHGPIAMDFAVQMLKRWIGVAWPTGASVRSRFIAAVKPGDRITASGRVVRVEPATSRVVCEFLCENQAGERVIVGELECVLAG